MSKKFYDTCALLNSVDDETLFEEQFYVSSVTLHELEHIKTSRNKDEHTRYSARKLTRLLDTNYGKYSVVIFDNTIQSYINKELGLNCDIPDNCIVGSAKYILLNHDILFVTDDICLKNIARAVGLNVCSTYDNLNKKIDYTGFTEKEVTEEQLAYLYEHMKENIYDLLLNQYLIVKVNNEVVDILRWDGETHQQIFKKNVKSIYFEKLKPKDAYQQCAIDALVNCTITAITGKAGSGKSLLSLMVAMYLIESGKYDRLVVMFNPTKVRGATDLGYYAGDFVDKAMQNSIGQILTTKFGDRYAVDLLMQQSKLKLVSMADCRGMEVNDNEILWITEGQNTSIDLIKLCLSRVSSGAKVIVEGDYESQTDSDLFSGDNNGLKRMIEVFKDHEEFGYIQLQNVWRSKIAMLADKL